MIADPVTLKIQAKQHSPLATSPRPAGPSASPANSSTTGQKPCPALYYIQQRSVHALCRERHLCQHAHVQTLQGVLYDE